MIQLRQTFRIKFFLIVISLVLLASCADKPTPIGSSLAEGDIEASPQNESQPTAAEDESLLTDAVQQETSSAGDEGEVNPSENSDIGSPANEDIQPFTITTRPVPEDFNWKDQAILPEISQTAFDIFEYGIKNGRDPNHTSVIGDCQAIPFVFLGKYGLGQYTLDPVDAYLGKMIDFYSDSFEREGNAVRGGFTAAAVLSAVRADPDQCMPGETPLDCEWRIHNPSVVFINLETWREEGTVDRYELYLEKIVEYAIERGTLPIIIMKADKAESETHVINPAMARVAYQYDIPLINFWRSAQYLDNYGIDANREGFHLSEEGYDLKQILALRTLYKIWEVEVYPQLEAESSEETQVNVEEENSEIEATQATVSLLEMPSFQCQNNCIYFDRFTTTAGGVQSEGIFELNLDTQKFVQITPAGVALQDSLINQQIFLINQGTDLYLVNQKNATISLLLDNLYPLGGSSAYFSADGKTITALVTDQQVQTIIQIQTENPAIQTPITLDGNPIQLITYRPSDSIYWKSGTCGSQDFCQITGYWETSLNQNGSTTTAIEGKENLVFSPDGSGMAFRDPQYADKTNYDHNPILLYEEVETGINSRRLYTFPHPGGFLVHPEVASYVFSPDNSQIFVLSDAYSDYFEKSVALHFYTEELEMRMVFEHGQLEGAFGSLSPQAVWSPDNDEVTLLFINTNNDREYTFEIYQKNILDRFSKIVPIIEPTPLENYTYLHNAYWYKGQND